LFRNQKDEDTVVKWVFYEVVKHLKEKNCGQSQRWINNYLTTTKIHKILYDVFEKNDIAVTRSWYRPGCFIHSPQLSSDNFSALRNRFINTKNSGLRNEAKKLGIQTESIIDALIQTTDIMPPRVDNYIETLYESNVPFGLSNIYTSKYTLQKSLKQIGRSLQNSHDEFDTVLADTRKNFSSFQMAIYTKDWFDNITDIASNFTTIIEQAILKAQYLLKRNRLFAKQINYISKMDSFFDNNIWHLFALKTSAETVKGTRASIIRESQLSKQKQKIPITITALSTLSNELGSMHLTLDWSEYATVIKSTHTYEPLRNAVTRMEKLYEGVP